MDCRTSDSDRASDDDDDVIPVSYTHLDVYKRQAECVCSRDVKHQLNITIILTCLLYTSPQKYRFTSV